MANVEYRARGIEAVIDPTAARRPLFSAVRWGAIIAGVAAGVSVQLVLTLLGLATGLSVADITADTSETAMGAVLWAGASMLIAAFIGGYVAARMSGLKRKSDGMLHGLISWAVTTLLFATLAASAGGTLLGSVFNTMNSMAPAVMQGSSRADSSALVLLRAQVGNLDSRQLDELTQHIRAGERDAAIQQLTVSGMETGRAATVVDQALIVSGSAENASPQARAAANRAVGDVGMTAWALFGAVALALVLGMLGGVSGSFGARRPIWVGNTAVAGTV